MWPWRLRWAWRRMSSAWCCLWMKWLGELSMSLPWKRRPKGRLGAGMRGLGGVVWDGPRGVVLVLGSGVRVARVQRASGQKLAFVRKRLGLSSGCRGGEASSMPVSSVWWLLTRRRRRPGWVSWLLVGQGRLGSLLIQVSAWSAVCVSSSCPVGSAEGQSVGSVLRASWSRIWRVRLVPERRERV